MGETLMPIVKRLNNEERHIKLFGDDWKLVFKVPILASMVNKSCVNYIDTADDNLVRICSKVGARTLSELSLDERIFIYVLSVAMRRAFKKSILTDQQHEIVARHMSAITTMDKIEASEGTSLLFRQILLWDFPKFLDDFPPGRTLPLPRPVQPSKASLAPVKAPKKKKLKLIRSKPASRA
jgi:hypothetical protein